MTPERRKNIARMLAPKTVAFIGGNGAASAAHQCVIGGFKGKIWGVNPKRDNMAGQPCFASVADLPEGPDAVFLAVPASVAIDTVRELREKDCGSVISFTAGFGELGAEGAEQERKLVEACGDMALIGPNCSGILNFIHDASLWPFDHGGDSVERGVAFITQSGMLGNTVSISQRSIPFSYIISSGNQAMLGVEDLLEVLIDDPHVSAIALYIEGLKDVKRFADMAIHALEAGVPIIVHKAGTSEIGAELTVSHTGSLSGTDSLYEALFERLGIIRVESTVAMMETIKMVTIAGAPKGPRLAALTCSGGDSTMLADGGEPLGLTFPKPSAKIVEALTELLPPIATAANPLDYTTPMWGFEEPFEQVVKTMLKDDYDAAIMVQDYPVLGPESGRVPYQADARAFIRATKAAGIPAAICNILPENMDNAERQTMIDGDVAPLQGIRDALTAVAGASKFGSLKAKIDALGNVDHLRLHELPPLPENSRLMDEWEGKNFVAAHGVPVPQGALVKADQAATVAAEIGFPVVVKLVNADLPHKTEAGAVKIGLKDEAEVAQAVQEIITSVNAYALNLSTDKFLVEKMADTPVAELILGIRRDPAFGLVMVIGSGGILVELIRDAATLLLPATRDDISNAIASLKVSHLLDGYRGKAAADKVALIDTVTALAEFADKHRDTLVELDINPLMASASGVNAVDVLLRVSN